MSKTDETFETLGYVKEEFGKSQIVYSRRLDFEGYAICTIKFDKKRKLVRLEGHYTILELQAVIEKYKELGWIE